MSPTCPPRPPLGKGTPLQDCLTYLTSSGMFQDFDKMPAWFREDKESRLMGTPSGVCGDREGVSLQRSGLALRLSSPSLCLATLCVS